MYIWLENLKYNILNFKTTYYNLIFPMQLRDTDLSLKLAYELTINNIKTSFICITNSNSSSPTLIISLEDTPISFQPRSFLIILRERINQYGHGLRITSFQPSQAFIIGLEMGWSKKKIDLIFVLWCIEELWIMVLVPSCWLSMLYWLFMYEENFYKFVGVVGRLTLFKDN